MSPSLTSTVLFFVYRLFLRHLRFAKQIDLWMPPACSALLQSRFAKQIVVNRKSSMSFCSSLFRGTNPHSATAGGLMCPSPEPRFPLRIGYVPARRAFEPHLNGANFAQHISPAFRHLLPLPRRMLELLSLYLQSLVREIGHFRVRPCTALPQFAMSKIPLAGAAGCDESMVLMIYFAYPINEEG
jgi:hypothetical protein